MVKTLIWYYKSGSYLSQDGKWKYNLASKELASADPDGPRLFIYEGCVVVNGGLVETGGDINKFNLEELVDCDFFGLPGGIVIKIRSIAQRVKEGRTITNREYELATKAGN